MTHTYLSLICKTPGIATATLLTADFGFIAIEGVTTQLRESLIDRTAIINRSVTTISDTAKKKEKKREIATEGTMEFDKRVV